MKTLSFPRSTPRLATTMVILLAASLLHAEEPIIIPLSQASPALKIQGLRELKTEYLPEGVLRFTYAIPEAKKGAASVNYELPQSVSATLMNFEMKQAQAERLYAGITLQSGRKLIKRLESLGPEWNSYSVDLAGLAGDEKIELEPIASVRISFRTNAEAGEQSVELRNWRLE